MNLEEDVSSCPVSEIYKSVFVFGGTGSLGTCIIDLWSQKVKEFIVFSRSETTQWALRQKFPTLNIKYILGDVCNLHDVKSALTKYDPTLIIVASAMKHIERCEEYIEKCIDTNVKGLLNIVSSLTKLCAFSNRSLQKVIMVSTDKACSPVNVYGMSKSICERIVKGSEIKGVSVVCVRYGNVISSNGSIVPVLCKQALDSNIKEFTLTDARMTRFCMTLPQSVKLIEDAILYGQQGDIWIPKLPGMKINDVLLSFSEWYSKPIKIIGIRPGEKIHETLISKTESLNTITRGDNYVILPNFVPDAIEFDYNSNDSLLSLAEVKMKIQEVIGSPKTVLVLGATGLLGSYVSSYFSRLKNYKVICTNRHSFSVNETTIGSMSEFLLREVGDSRQVYVINCIGLTNKILASNEEFMLVNGKFPQELAKVCSTRGWQLIHPSTDCVFDGKLASGYAYVEADMPLTNDIYGRSKLIGENHNGMTIRLSFIGDSSNGLGLYDFIKSSFETVNGYANHYWTGVTALEYAKILHQIIENPSLRWIGVRHIVPPYQVTKYELINTIKLTHNLNVTIQKVDDTNYVNRKLATVYDTQLVISPLEKQLKELKDYVK